MPHAATANVPAAAATLELSGNAKNLSQPPGGGIRRHAMTASTAAHAAVGSSGRVAQRSIPLTGFAKYTAAVTAYRLAIAMPPTAATPIPELIVPARPCSG